MSNKTYPCILKSKSEHDNRIMLAFNKNECQCINSEAMSNYCGFDFDASENWIDITREYLSDTYGKCESQEHADFICELAENAGFTFRNDYGCSYNHFWFDGAHMEFDEAKEPIKEKAKLINLPLPPKEKPMEETKPEKPIYTKEMHERGELPPVGSEISTIKTSSCRVRCEVLKIRNNGSFDVVAVQALEEKDDIELNELFYCAISDIKPTPTIEDELINEINKWAPLYACNELAQVLLSKYNITPKGD